MTNEAEPTRSTAELLAEWRAAGRDTVAARAAARVAALALEAATTAEHAASEVEAAANAALESLDKARAAALSARTAATEAAAAAAHVLEGAASDRLQANRDVEITEQAEVEARDAYHRAEDAAHHGSTAGGE